MVTGEEIVLWYVTGIVIAGMATKGVEREATERMVVTAVIAWVWPIVAMLLIVDKIRQGEGNETNIKTEKVAGEEKK